MGAGSEQVGRVVLLPWEAVHGVTAVEYLRKSRFFLEFGGFVDPRLMCHRRGVNKMVVPRERLEIERGMRVFVERSVAEPGFALSLVLRFVEAQKRRVAEGLVSPATVRNCLKPIKLALELNDVTLPWKKVMRLIPSCGRSRDRPYTLEEIRRLVNAASLHLKVAILFMVSSGMRVGAFDYLKVGHVKPFVVDGVVACGRVLVYAGEREEYETLISKEAYLAFQEYLEARRSSGEEVTEDSPAIAVRGGKRACRSASIRNAICDLLRKTGVRTGVKKRFETQCTHGFRKFFDNVAKDFMDEEYVEKLMGHDTGVKEHYDRHLPKPLIEQYLKAMPYLSVDQAYRVEAELKAKLEAKQQEVDSKYTQLKLELLEKEMQMRRLQEQIQEMQRTLNILANTYRITSIERASEET